MTHDEVIEAFRTKKRGAVLAAAGCGKTELVARAAQAHARNNEPVLVLTHTHAGVNAIRQRLRSKRSAKCVGPSSSVALKSVVRWPASKEVGDGDTARVEVGASGGDGRRA
jgi:DNA helicase-2/ATP-dependent DNA helicase PcrA